MKKITTLVQLDKLIAVLSKDYPDCDDLLHEVNVTINESKQYYKEDVLVRMSITDIKYIVGFVAYNAAIEKV